MVTWRVVEISSLGGKFSQRIENQLNSLAKEGQVIYSVNIVSIPVADAELVKCIIISSKQE